MIRRTFAVVLETLEDKEPPTNQEVMDEIQSALESAYPYSVIVESVTLTMATATRKAKR